jgi:hypothetical protein
VLTSFSRAGDREVEQVTMNIRRQLSVISVIAVIYAWMQIFYEARGRGFLHADPSEQALFVGVSAFYLFMAWAQRFGHWLPPTLLLMAAAATQTGELLLEGVPTSLLGFGLKAVLFALPLWAIHLSFLLAKSTRVDP